MKSIRKICSYDNSFKRLLHLSPARNLNIASKENTILIPFINNLLKIAFQSYEGIFIPKMLLECITLNC